MVCLSGDGVGVSRAWVCEGPGEGGDTTLPPALRGRPIPRASPVVAQKPVLQRGRGAPTIQPTGWEGVKGRDRGCCGLW